MKSWAIFAVGLVLSGFFSARPLAASTINTGVVTMTTTGGESSITLDVSIADNGAVPGCTYFLILRDGSLAGIFPRQIGAQNTFQVVDANAAAGHTYWYELKASAFPGPLPSPLCDETEFRLAFGSSWGGPIDVPGHVGDGPYLLDHGTLVADGVWPYAHLEPCSSLNWWFFEYGLPAGFEQYLGQDVLMYGEYPMWSVQNGWIPSITAFELLPCVPIAVESTTWGKVKSMYR